MIFGQKSFKLFPIISVIYFGSELIKKVSWTCLAQEFFFRFGEGVPWRCSLCLVTALWKYSAVEGILEILHVIVLSRFLTFVHKWASYSIVSLNYAKCVWFFVNLIVTVILCNYAMIRYLWLVSCYIFTVEVRFDGLYAYPHSAQDFQIFLLLKVECGVAGFGHFWSSIFGWELRQRSKKLKLGIWKNEYCNLRGTIDIDRAVFWSDIL